MVLHRLVATVASPANIESLALTQGLDGSGVGLEFHHDPASSLLAIGRAAPDLVILPTDVRGIDPVDYVDAVAHVAAAPVVVAMAEGENDRALAVAALDRGARGLVGLPLVASEVEAMLRQFAPDGKAPTVLAAGPLTMDLLAHRVSMDGEDVYFTAREFTLLQLLLGTDRVVSADELAEMASQLPDSSVPGIRVMIGRIRRKLEGSSRSGTVVLETVRGVGYRITR